MDLIIYFYWRIGISLIIIYLLILYVEILPFLRKHHSSSLVSWLTNYKQDKDLEKYKELCLKENKSLFWYNFLASYNKCLIFYLIGWMVLIFL